jgi:predicted metal-dependent hydrolase
MTVLSRVRYGDTVIHFRIERAPRPSPRIRVHVEPDGRVIVQAPKDVSASVIGQVVRRRARWIHAHLQAISERKSQFSPREWVSGESHRYLGRRYMLKVRVNPAGCERVILTRGEIRVSVQTADPARVRGLVQEWYRQRAGAWLRDRVAELARRLPWVRRIPLVAIRHMKSRWGSCSPAGRLTLNPVLIRAPRQGVDYVIVHELCHLRYHNHGKAFYELLGRYVPGWEDIKKRLDNEADRLLSESGRP